MGKIIEFPIKSIMPDYMTKTEGIKLYYRYYKTTSAKEQEWTLQMIGLNLANSITNTKYLKTAAPQEMLELIAYAAAKRQLKTDKANSQYYRKLSELLEKYGEELMGFAKEN